MARKLTRNRISIAILCAIPYGIMADKKGRKPVLYLAFFGLLLMVLWIDIVRKSLRRRRAPRIVCGPVTADAQQMDQSCSRMSSPYGPSSSRPSSPSSAASPPWDQL